jgi:CheY-like chemotaxis protein
MRVLVVEDEERLAGALARGLTAEGFDVEVVHDGLDGWWRASERPYGAIVLDLMLPGMNGYQVCRKLRDAGIWTPILMLTAKDGEYDEAEALDTGADDSCPSPSPTSCSSPACARSNGAGAPRDPRCCAWATCSSTRAAASAGARAPRSG